MKLGSTFPKKYVNRQDEVTRVQNGALAFRCYPPNNRAAIGHLLRHLACHGRVGEVLKVPFTANFNKSHQHKLEVQ